MDDHSETCHWKCVLSIVFLWYSFRDAPLLCSHFHLFTCIKRYNVLHFKGRNRSPTAFCINSIWLPDVMCPLQYFALSPAPQVHHANFSFFFFSPGFLVAAKLVEISLGMLVAFSKALKLPETKALSILVSLGSLWTTHQHQKSFWELSKNPCMMLWYKWIESLPPAVQ